MYVVPPKGYYDQPRLGNTSSVTVVGSIYKTLHPSWYITGRSSTPDVKGLPDLADVPDRPKIWWYRMLTKQPCPLEEPGVLAGQVHTHLIAMNWWMCRGTCHQINKLYEITAALLESSCATVSSPVYLNWSSPSRTSWKIRSSSDNIATVQFLQYIV